MQFEEVMIICWNRGHPILEVTKVLIKQAFLWRDMVQNTKCDGQCPIPKWLTTMDA